MIKEIIETDKERGIVRVTTADERWYLKTKENKKGLPEYNPVPSVTWICESYPKGIGFYKWLADKGWDEAQAIKSAAGDKGSKVHNALSAIIRGEEVRVDSEFMDSSGNMSQLVPIEIEAIMSFKRWCDAVNPEFIAWDGVLFSDKHEYAGTFDAIAKIGEDMYLIDFKTSQNVWAAYELQVSAYRQTILNGENPIEGVKDLKLAILQVGYARNKNGYKWNEVEDKFDLFLAAKKFWANERASERSKKGFSQIEYPIILSEGRNTAETN